MNETANTHWTRDAELLEQFVLHRVDEAKRKQLESHLLTCEECQKAVKAEQLIALGVKRAGREEMKMRLRERLMAAEPQTTTVRVPWMRIASVAAVVVILVGLGIYDHWFVKGPESTGEQLIDKDTSRDRPPATEQPAERREETLREEPVSRVGRQDQALQETREAMARRQEQEPQRDAAEALKLQAPTQEIAGARKKDERAADVDQLGTEQDVTAKTTGIWIEGTLIEEKESTGFVKTEGARSEDKLKALQQRAPMQPTAAKQAVTVTVMERSLEELPTPQRLYQERFQKRSIQTQVERMGDELHFTVYRDTPELQGKRQNAVLQQIGRDSVVMVVGKDQIGYKIPGGIDALKAQKK